MIFWPLPTVTMPEVEIAKPRARSASWSTPICTPGPISTALSMIARRTTAPAPTCTWSKRIASETVAPASTVHHGETTLLPGELVDRSKYNDINRATLTEGKKTASARQEVMGITKASLATESWLSAASFQETTKVLTEAALAGKRDPLLGLKENVIIGKLIPAGTGLARYRDVTVEATEEAKAERYPNRLFADAGSVDEADLSYLDFDAFTGGELGEQEPGQYV